MFVIHFREPVGQRI